MEKVSRAGLVTVWMVSLLATIYLFLVGANGANVDILVYCGISCVVVALCTGFGFGIVGILFLAGFLLGPKAANLSSLSTPFVATMSVASAVAIGLLSYFFFEDSFWNSAMVVKKRMAKGSLYYGILSAAVVLGSCVAYGFVGWWSLVVSTFGLIATYVVGCYLDEYDLWRYLASLRPDQ